ncbi:hypothetical protein J2T15_006249 [Paenibacillus harenae]|uniref:Uncharacterized protein n=1 Tax=Paenibacillus harenae TaxID=306543 RepID=A0ABT9UAW4_PAEHA|nr:hypothetical protein [Paenibacillus harenae]MDQ0116767.1 hypothetical protein [Paenibacillus harenae]
MGAVADKQRPADPAYAVYVSGAKIVNLTLIGEL